MRARINNKDLGSIRSAGIMFGKEWTEVPAWAEREIQRNPFLEIEQPAPVEVTSPPAAQAEQPAEEPQTVETKAVKLVVKKPGKSRKARKL